MTLHTYEVTLSVTRLETVSVTVGDADLVWVSAPDEATLEREARALAYHNYRHECYVVGSKKSP